jgi:predicted hotdog family 3-hydroxylacyl-ACP dehydratase
MRLTKAQIAGMIPHAGSMCLLAEVCEADDTSIRCRAVSHRDAGNPLRDPTGLPAICGVEYAAQAMAVHGAIACGGISGPGMLASARDVVLYVPRLDVLAADIFVIARRLVGDGRRLMYEFELQADAARLLHGRATVVLGA